MALKFYTSVAKGLNTKSQNFLGANSHVCRCHRRKTGKGNLFGPPTPPPILNRVKVFPCYFSYLGPSIPNLYFYILKQSWISSSRDHLRIKSQTYVKQCNFTRRFILELLQTVSKQLLCGKPLVFDQLHISWI